MKISGLLCRSGEIHITDKDTGALRANYRSVTVLLCFSEGAEVEAGMSLAEWDPFAVSILDEVSGKVRYNDMKEGQSIEERTDR